MIDTVVSVRPRNDNKPGFIKFSSAGEKSTFSDGVLDAASRLIGQRAEYTLEERQGKGGKTFYNVGSIVPVSGVAGASSSYAPAPIDSRVQGNVELLSIASALNRIATALEWAARPDRTPQLPLQEKPREGESDQASDQARLAAKVGNDAAKAMLAALNAKYKDDEPRAAAIAALLLAHGA